MPSVTQIELIVKGTDIRRSFNITHAERLLAMGEKGSGGWVLPENSKYYYSEQNGIRLKQSTRGNRQTK